jgi:hypothetical protein
MQSRRNTIVVLACIAASGAEARGVSPYLPLQTTPEIERQIERLLILADKPVMRRPIAAATVIDALPIACERDAQLCESVRRYLAAYMHTAGITGASLAVGGGSGASVPVPNRHGMASDSGYELAAQLYWQPGDRMLVTAGGVTYDGDSTPTGTMVSLGDEHAQLDIGYRDHWLSPMTDSAMLLGTEAATMPSVTISNYAPLTRWGLQYEAFVAKMSESDNIVFNGALTSGRPLLAGVHLSIEPFPGWSIAVSRVLQYGGGERAHSVSDLVRAFVDPSSDNTGTQDDPAAEFGNQAAAFSTEFLVQGKVPYAVYFEYAGEDTSTTSNVRLGNVSLSAGLRFPQLWQRFALTFEASEWQNAWYEHHIYRDGLRNDGRVIGHWGADWRVPGDAVGARSIMMRVGWSPQAGGQAEATYRALDNEDYGVADYRRGHMLELRYSHPWREFLVGGEIETGRDTFGATFSRASAFLRF